WKEWSDPRFICCVVNNRDLNMVTWEQRVMVGDIKFNPSQDLPDFPYARYAESLGLTGIRVEHPEEIGTAWDRALSADRPVILEAICDPEVAPLPPHITIEQAKNFAESVMKGDPSAGHMVRHAVKEMIDTILPRK